MAALTASGCSSTAGWPASLMTIFLPCGRFAPTSPELATSAWSFPPPPPPADPAPFRASGTRRSALPVAVNTQRPGDRRKSTEDRDRVLAGVVYAPHIQVLLNRTDARNVPDLLDHLALQGFYAAPHTRCPRCAHLDERLDRLLEAGGSVADTLGRLRHGDEDADAEPEQYCHQCGLGFSPV